MSGIYLHIPFCKQACSYCDFYFVTRKERKADFVKALVREIESVEGSRYSKDPISTIYLGGGTPSLLTIAELEQIFGALHKVFEVKGEEITIELNPDDVSPEYLKGLKELGVNRVSMGVQSFDEGLLRFMNRAHSADEARKCMDYLKNSEIDVFTVDLIYGNPGQSIESLDKDLDILLSYGPPHVSAYSLTIEPGTRLGKQLELGRLLPAEDEQVSRHFDLVESRLLEKDIRRYEVSNFARPGKEAIHNSNYWAHKNYLGFGPGAHSFRWDEKGESAQRWMNRKDLNQYLEGKSEMMEGQEELSLKELAEERIMLALRTTAGISLRELAERYGYQLSEVQMQYLKNKEKEGKLVLKEKLLLTSKGLKIADAITLDLLSI